MFSETVKIEVVFQFGMQSIAIIIVADISADILVIANIFNNLEATDIFSKPCKLPCLLDLGVFRNQP